MQNHITIDKIGQVCTDECKYCVDLSDSGNIACSFEEKASNLSYLSKKYDEKTSFTNENSGICHREFYIIKSDHGWSYNMASLGTEFECKFIEAWMELHGYYTE